ncbi:hypothetical protein, partial [Parabacteroides chinchillae]
IGLKPLKEENLLPPSVETDGNWNQAKDIFYLPTRCPVPVPAFELVFNMSVFGYLSLVTCFQLSFFKMALA